MTTLIAALSVPFRSGRLIIAALSGVCIMVWTVPAAAKDTFTMHDGELGFNVYGFSYHFQRERAHELGTDNEVNPGIGLRFRFAEWGRWSFFTDMGGYKDSGREPAIIVGVGGLWRLGYGFNVGGALAYFNSETYNGGEPFVAPIPILSYDRGAFTINATYFPKVANYNEVATLGFWFTIWPRRW